MPEVREPEELEEEYDSAYEYYEEDGDLPDDCALRHDGQCGMAGTEWCDFVCSMRDSEFFAGSKAWIKAHTVKHRRKFARRYL